MGKFYVVIRAAEKTYKVCKDDVKIVHSKHKLIKPALPRFDDLNDSKKELDTTQSEDSDVQFEPLQLGKSKSG
jgi:hypothetical protein